MMKAVSSEAPHGGMVRFLLGFDDWSFLKKRVKTYILVPISPSGSPTF
jgi:hypothetical protein